VSGSLTLTAGEKPVVFVSLPPQAWLVKRLAGEAVEVQTLLTPGANPHTFEPGARQVKKLADASLYLTLGMPFETQLVGRAGKLNTALKVVAMDAGIAKLGMHHEHGSAPGHLCSADGGDPHIWLSPRRFCAMASNTVAALEQLLPQQQASLTAKLCQTVTEIAETDTALRDSLQKLTVKTWVVYHPSWSYLAADYGLSLLVIEEDGKAPAARHLAEIIGQARAAGVQIVCAEPQYDKRPAQTLAEQIGARLETLDPLQEDWVALLRNVAEKLGGRGKAAP
jgi:zinc transport system substrate-binding protein